MAGLKRKRLDKTDVGIPEKRRQSEELKNKTIDDRNNNEVARNADDNSYSEHDDSHNEYDDQSSVKDKARQPVTSFKRSSLFDLIDEENRAENPTDNSNQENREESQRSSSVESNSVVSSSTSHLKPSSVWDSTASSRVASNPDLVHNNPDKKQSSYKYYNSNTVSNLFQKRDLKNLTELLKDISSQFPADLQEYQHSVKLKERQADKLIQSLVTENKNLKSKVVSLKSKMSTMKQEMKSSEKEARNELRRWTTILQGAKEREDELESQVLKLRTRSDVSNIIESHNAQMGFLELLTGTCSVAFYEDDQNITFTIKQTGTIGTHYYKLIVSKPDELVKEIVYKPIWEEPAQFTGNWQENVILVKDNLPEYLLNELSFPSTTLKMFYNKINANLN